MITRIFKATVHGGLHGEFENNFVSIAVPLVKSQAGLVSVDIARPSKWSPNDFLMISVWKDEDSIKNFAGDNWNEALIPDGMEKYFVSCSIEHYINIDL